MEDSLFLAVIVSDKRKNPRYLTLRASGTNAALLAFQRQMRKGERIFDIFRSVTQ